MATGLTLKDCLRALLTNEEELRNKAVTAILQVSFLVCEFFRV